MAQIHKAGLTSPEVVAFHERLTKYYYESGRHEMLWRRPDKNGRFDPYKIMVSELMLQQTQVERVTPKYVEFLQAFSTVETLAAVELGDVLKVWNGLGYNRRAKFIWQAAGMVVKDFEGQFPETEIELIKLPGIGPNTAGAIVAYAYNQPALFIETNVRTVIIHHFFNDKTNVPDAAIRQVLEQILPRHPQHDKTRMAGAVLGPREFYWALMDYGTHLKKTVGNLSRSSRHYNKQSTFQGSRRQLRGLVIKLLTEGPRNATDLHDALPDERLGDVLAVLTEEGMITISGGTYRLS